MWKNPNPEACLLSPLQICVLGDAKHCDEATKLGIEMMTVDDLKKLNKNKKLVNKLAKKYHLFLASESVIKQIPRLLGPGLNKAGTFPLKILNFCFQLDMRTTHSSSSVVPFLKCLTSLELQLSAMSPREVLISLLTWS